MRSQGAEKATEMLRSTSDVAMKDSRKERISENSGWGAPPWEQNQEYSSTPEHGSHTTAASKISGFALLNGGLCSGSPTFVPPLFIQKGTFCLFNS